MTHNIDKFGNNIIKAAIIPKFKVKQCKDEESSKSPYLRNIKSSNFNRSNSFTENVHKSKSNNKLAKPKTAVMLPQTTDKIIYKHKLNPFSNPSNVFEKLIQQKLPIEVANIKYNYNKFMNRENVKMAKKLSDNRTYQDYQPYFLNGPSISKLVILGLNVY